MDTQHLPAYVSLSWIAILLAACFFMLFSLQPGLPIAGEIAPRMQYINDNAFSWKLGWYSWMASAIGLLMFAVFLRPYLRPGMLANIGTLLIGFGVLPDLAAETLFKDRLPGITDSVAFDHYETLAVQLTGTIANGAYNIGGLALNIAMFGNPLIPRGLTWAGLPAWSLGLGLSLATANNWMLAAFWFTATAMPLSIAWCTAVIVILFMQPQRYAFRENAA